MTETEALARMVAPGQRRPTKWLQGVVQIHVTRACDKACFGCTQGSNLAGKTTFMTPEQFAAAVRSLDGYFGVVGVFGGNPAVSPHFADYCQILRELVPFERRGLWCNHPMGKGAAMRGTFNPAYSNLNVHLDREAYEQFKRDWPESMPFGLTQDSRHSPPWVAVKDVEPDEGKRWEMISRCDVNQFWSAMIGVFRGELRAWFCELAGAASILHQDEPDYPDTGIPLPELYRREPLSPDGEVIAPSFMGPYPSRHDFLPWWQRPMEAFAHQVRKHCHECGVALRGHGALAQDESGTEQVSETHRAVFRPKRKGRAVELVTTRAQLNEGRIKRATDYIGNAAR